MSKGLGSFDEKMLSICPFILKVSNTIKLLRKEPLELKIF